MPCKERVVIYENIHKAIDEIQISRRKWHGVFVGAFITIIASSLAVGIAWGTLSSDVASNREKIRRLSDGDKRN
jgi:hypothetical protein